MICNSIDFSNKSEDNITFKSVDAYKQLQWGFP